MPERWKNLVLNPPITKQFEGPLADLRTSP